MKLLQSIQSTLTAALKERLGGFARDERGATMTEFIITLPIFILIFAGIANLSRLNKAVVRTSGMAYSDLWDNALPVQKGDPGVHNSVSHSGSAIRTNMNTYHDKQPEQFVRQTVKRESNDQGSGLIDNGTLGESAARVRSTRDNIELRNIHSQVTPNIGGVVGESGYAKLLFDDSSSAPKIGSNLTIPSTRMVTATGVNYGEEMGTNTQTITIAGQPMHVYQYYSTLVSPHWRHEDAATKVTHEALDEFGAYNNLLGFARTQPLNRSSQSVEKIKGAMP